MTFHSTDKPSSALVHVLSMYHTIFLMNCTRFKCSTSNNHNFSYLGLRGKKKNRTLFAYKTVLKNFFKTKHQITRFLQMLQMNAACHTASVGVSLPQASVQAEQGN